MDGEMDGPKFEMIQVADIREQPRPGRKPHESLSFWAEAL